MAEPAGFQTATIVEQLAAVRRRWRESQNRVHERGGREFPSRDAVAGIVAQLKGALFPLRLGPPDLRREVEDFYVGHTLDAALHALTEQVQLELGSAHPPADATAHVTAFAQALPALRERLDTDVLAAYQGDPAARSVDEVLLCYPGVLAVIHHRLAYQLYGLGLPLLARIVAELAHAETGIDIHPGAQIGESFFIDHGTGVVIGETAVIGRRVRLYQAVTLGARRFVVGEDGGLEKGQPRHPVVEDDVVIYAGATVLGRVTVGQGAVIGGNVWVTHDVPPGAHDVPPGAHITQAVARQNGQGV